MKAKYETPEVQTVEVKMEGVICGSGSGSETMSLMILMNGDFSSGSDWGRDGYGGFMGF